MNRFAVKLTGGVMALSFVVAGCGASGESGGGSRQGSEGPTTTTIQEYRNVSEWEGSGYDIDWPSTFEFQQVSLGGRQGVEEGFIFSNVGGGYSVRGLLFVDSAIAPYQEGQMYLRRELQSLLDEFNFRSDSEVQATAQGTLSVAPGSPHPGLFVNVLGVPSYGVAAVVPLDEDRLLKVVLVSRMKGGEEDPEIKQILADTITSVTVG